jgi:Spy/CpxP family protein refolding chaperone
MRKRIFLLPAIALLGCMMASIGWSQVVSGTKSDSTLNQQPQARTIFSYKDEVGLTDNQETKLKALLYDEQALVDANNSTLKTLGSELGKMIDDKEDMGAIKSKLEEISKIQIEATCRNIEDSRKEEAILTPDQLAKWKEVQKRFSSQAKS